MKPACCSSHSHLFKGQPSSLHAALLYAAPREQLLQPCHFVQLLSELAAERSTPINKLTSSLSSLAASFICGLHPQMQLLTKVLVRLRPPACPAAGEGRHSAHLKPVLPGSPLLVLRLQLSASGRLCHLARRPTSSPSCLTASSRWSLRKTSLW